MKNLFSRPKIVITGNMGNYSPVPLFCDLCKFPMKSLDDGISHREHGACKSCSDSFVYHKHLSFKNNKEALMKSKEWSDYIKSRNRSARNATKIRFK